MTVEIEKLQTIKLEPNEVLVVHLKDTYADLHTIKQIQEYLRNLLETQRILVYSGGQIDFLKVQLEEKLVDKFVDDLIQK